MITKDGQQINPKFEYKAESSFFTKRYKKFLPKLSSGISIRYFWTILDHRKLGT